MSQHRRGLGPIRTSHDRATAIEEIEAILRSGPSDADREYIRALDKVLQGYDQYCDEGRDKPIPVNMVRYQIEVAQRTTPESVAKETGIADLDCLLRFERDFTSAEVARLAEYFGISEDQFLE
jgi:antitoxin component HigA of HigAB toxin-antitoxin module